MVCLRSFALSMVLILLAAVPAAAKPLVIATFYPLYEFARQVGGPHVEVVSLVPTGVEPHEWEPMPQHLVQVGSAQVFVYNGAGLEPWVDRLVKEVARKDLVVVRATAGLPLLKGGDHDHSPGAQAPGHSAHPGAAFDPHVWLDPVHAQAQVEAIRAALTKVDPAHAATYAANAEAYKARLASLHTAFTQGLARCTRRDLVVSHAAFGYLAKRYRLTQIPITGLSPEAEPSPADLAGLVTLAKQRKVTHVFFESLVSPKLAETLAREIGAQTLVLNPLEGLTADDLVAGKDYVSVMEDNLRNLRTALECR